MSRSTQRHNRVVVACMILFAAGSPAEAQLDGQFTIVVQSGDTAPDGDGVFAGFDYPVLNNDGLVAVEGFLTDTSSISGLFLGDSAQEAGRFFGPALGQMGQGIVYGRLILRPGRRSFFLQRIYRLGERIDLVAQRTCLGLGRLGKLGLLYQLFGQFARGRAGYGFRMRCVRIRRLGFSE